MITDEVSIYNLALNAVGTRSNIALPNEKSREAEVCRLWFGPVRDRVLRAAPWPSTKAWARLALRKERNDQESWVIDDPEPGFQFAYAPPIDMLAPRYLAGYQRFSLSSYPGNKLAIMTSQDAALLCYTKQQTVISLWDVSLQMAIVYGLASYIAMPLQGKAQRAQQAMNEANNLIISAREQAANDDVAQITTTPDWIAARGYSTGVMDTRYFYPSGALFTAGELGV
jgi:hypothetical protein